MARDLEASQRFYGAVVGWSFRRARLGSAFSVAVVDDVPVAGIGALATDLAVAVAWTPYFAVDDVDVATARVRERSGTVGVGPVSFPGGGRAALVADVDGAAFGVWQGPVSAGWRVGVGPAPAWLELRTRNAFDAALFYGEVLEWASGREGCCEVSYEDERVVLRQGGEPVARLDSGPVEQGAYTPHTRPRWHVHFRVADLDSAVEWAVDLGGRAVSVVTTDGAVRSIALRDPDGALFTLTERVAPPGPQDGAR
ncbi:VOC family protein [Streptomyces sp. NPDC012794]|uniref:VOC family protein n=1 Tax=Streptomyces sp. NPDC012794 TaxID=3364850 RepID=UPI00368AA887